MGTDEPAAVMKESSASEDTGDSSSALFHPYRMLGRVSNHIPAVTYRSEQRRETYIVTCVGRSWHIYSLAKLAITRASDPHDGDITALAADEYYIISAVGATVYSRAHRTNRLAAVFKGHTHTVTLLQPFGHHVISIDSGGTMLVWERANGKEYARMSLGDGSHGNEGPASFDPTAVCHPVAYMNKVVVASAQGSFQLWHVGSGRKLYTFAGWRVSVTALRASPKVDTIWVGLADGRVMLHNLKFDETVFTLRHGDNVPVTAIAWRQDRPATLLTASATYNNKRSDINSSGGGCVSVWDCEERILTGRFCSAAVGGLECAPGEPLAITSGAEDNSLRVWVFEGSAGAEESARVLHTRLGHAGPPMCLRFATDTDLLSGAADSSVCSFSTLHERHDRRLGVAYHSQSGPSLNEKKKRRKLWAAGEEGGRLPAIKAIALSGRRAREWPSAVTCHSESKWVSQWDVTRSTLAHSLQFGSKGVVTCLAVTACGNFAVLGFRSGVLEAINMQSRLSRGVFGKKKPHRGEVRGVAVGELNEMVISGGSDCVLKWWAFRSKALKGGLKMDSPVALMELHRANDMLAVGLDNFSVVIVDASTRKITRRLNGHVNALTCLTFAPHGRWLLTGSMSCEVLTFDLPTGQPIDRLDLDTPPSSLAFSPAGDLLAMATVDELGVTLLSNRSMYAHVSLLPIDLSIGRETSHTERRAPVTLDDQSDEEDSEETESHKSRAGRFVGAEDSSLIRLALLPASRWAHLLQLDLIRQRNKPIAPPTKPKVAPFFLPTTPGLVPAFDISGTGEDGENGQGAGSAKIPLSSNEEFLKLLDNHDSADGSKQVISFLKGLGPSFIDTSIRSLSAYFGETGSLQYLESFLLVLLASLRSCRDYEATQAYLSLTLKIHGEDIVCKPRLLSILTDIELAQKEQWTRLEESVTVSEGVIQYLKRAAL